MIDHLTERIVLADVTTDPVGTAVGWMTGITGIVVGVIGLLFLVLLVAAVISAVFDGNTTAGGKLLWVLFILWFPVFGAIAWFVVGRKGYLNRILGIDKGKVRHTSPASVGQHSDVRDSGPIPRPSTEHEPGGAQQYQAEPNQYQAEPNQYQAEPNQYQAEPQQHTTGPQQQYTTGPQQRYTTGPQQHLMDSQQYYAGDSRQHFTGRF
ncbi:hypothetical protein SUDANB121_03107 [Nocardiopsis dassonvillei]